MTISDVRVCATNGKRGTRGEQLCRVRVWPKYHDFGIWSQTFSRWKERFLSSGDAKAWCDRNGVRFEEGWLVDET